LEGDAPTGTTSVAFTRDGQTLVAVSPSQVVSWKVATGALVGSWKPHDAPEGCSFDASNAQAGLLAVPCPIADDGSAPVVLVDEPADPGGLLARHWQVPVPFGNSRPLPTVGLSTDGAYLAVTVGGHGGSGTNTIVLSTETGELLANLPLRAGRVPVAPQFDA